MLVPDHPGAWELASSRHPCSARWPSVISSAGALLAPSAHAHYLPTPPQHPSEAYINGLYETTPQPFLHRSEPSVALCLDPRRSPERQTGEARHPKPPIHHLLNSCPWPPCWAPCRQLQLPCSALGWRGTKRVHRLLPGLPAALHKAQQGCSACLKL